ncbi:MAG: DUF418 domain-containing protein [Chloroflexota bacterium]
MTTSPTATMLPVQQAERIQILDILRGFAVFGILAVNIAGFATPAFLPGYVQPITTPWYDHLAEALVQFFCEGKFYTIFSFLFGLGFSVQLARSEAKGKDIRSFYPRRLWVLLGLGILHAIFLWLGDILRLYALLGFALLAFRTRRDRTLLIWAAILFVLSFVLVAFSSDDSAIPGFDMIGMTRQVYTSPSYLNVLIFQFFGSIASFIFIALSQGPSVMALFLLGLLAGRIKFFEQLEENRPRLQRILVVGLIVGLLGNAVYLFTENIWLGSLGLTVGAPALAATYISGLSLLSLRPTGSKMIAPLANVGRMALSNYVLQSVVCAFMFGGFGFGLYEKVGAAGLLGITFAVYLLQIPLSAWWLGRFRFGPLEWVWRSLTYGQRQPMRKVAQ